MSLEDLVGKAYGPFHVPVTAERVGAYVAATGDDPDRWARYAPPSYAGALLFAAAPEFLADPVVVPYTKRLVHADQSFEWHRPVEADTEVTVRGVFTRARQRAGVYFATFESEVRLGEEPAISSVSTFLLGIDASGDDPAGEQEPPVAMRGEYDPPPARWEAPGEAPVMARSASRLDLVRYAAASGDFNPVHFDHDTAVAAGFPGVLVHGLLMGAWVLQVAAACSTGPLPFESARLRFRNPLHPAVTARVSGTAETDDAGRASVRLSLTDGETEFVTARMLVAGE